MIRPSIVTRPLALSGLIAAEGSPTRGVAPGYHIRPFQGLRAVSCLSSAIRRGREKEGNFFVLLFFCRVAVLERRPGSWDALIAQARGIANADLGADRIANADRMSCGIANANRMSCGMVNANRMACGIANADRMSCGIANADRMAGGMGNADRMACGMANADLGADRIANADRMSCGIANADPEAVGIVRAWP